MPIAISLLLLVMISSYAPFARAQAKPGKLVGDVIDFALQSDQWKGSFGWVTLRLWSGLHNGEKAYFIRTDSSNKSFAENNGLIFVPLLNRAIALGATGDLFLFKDIITRSGLKPLPVLSSIPGKADYSPFWRVHFITKATSPERLVSVEAIEAAKQRGEVKIETTDIVVNYPVVKWPGGEMPHDTMLEKYLGEGQLIGPVDLANMQATFKLQFCFPGMHYIVTDVSMEGGAKMMNIAFSPKIARLQQAPTAVANVFVLGNGIPGGGPMGFQSSLMDPVVGTPLWSPLWNHFTMVWRNPEKAVLITNFAKLKKEEDAGELQRFNGTPDTHPQGFIVNCSVLVASAVAPQPTSIKFSPSVISPGDSFTLMVGNGNNMTIDIQFTFTPPEGSPEPPSPTVVRSIPLDANGNIAVGTGPNFARGTYMITNIRNSDNAPWVSVIASLTVN